MPSERPQRGDIVRNAQRVEAEVCNWIGRDTIEVKVIHAPAGLHGEWPAGSLHDVHWTEWRFVRRSGLSHDPGVIPENLE